MTLTKILKLMMIITFLKTRGPWIKLNAKMDLFGSDFDLEQELDQEMPTALLIAKKSDIPVWPLDPIVIRYFKTHPAFHSIWYHAPY